MEIKLFIDEHFWEPLNLDSLESKFCISSGAIIQNMKKLQDNGLLKRVGADKNGHWEIVK